VEDHCSLLWLTSRRCGYVAECYPILSGARHCKVAPEIQPKHHCAITVGNRISSFFSVVWNRLVVDVAILPTMGSLFLGSHHSFCGVICAAILEITSIGGACVVGGDSNGIFEERTG